MIHAVTDMFVAGTESTASTLKWAILLLATRSDLQDRLYSEIKTSIGKDRMPCLEDRLQMPLLGKFKQVMLYWAITRMANIKNFKILLAP